MTRARRFDLKPRGTFPVDRVVSDAKPGDYDALPLPGGTVNPDQLRMNPDAVAFVKAFWAAIVEQFDKAAHPAG
jgi:protease I